MARYRRDIFRLIEASLIGLFFVQAVRFLYATLYAHVGSATLVRVTTNLDSISGMPGVVNPADVQTELTLAAIVLFLPLLSPIFSRFSFGPAILAIIAAAGRVFITANGGTTLGVIGAMMTAGAGALYLATITVRRSGFVPIALVMGFAGDQLIRLYGSTVDITLDAQFLNAQTVLSLALFVIAILTAAFERIGFSADDKDQDQRGEISGWSAFALGGLLYLEFAIFGLPNTVAHRAGVDYITVGPWLIVATLLPLVPEMRDLARRFLGMFDGQYRGWVWFLLGALLTVIGFRFTGTLAAVMLIAAQLMVCLSFWWIVQPTDGRRNFTGPGVSFALILFLLLTGADFFTYEYAFVRGIQEPIASMLRAFRGLGLVVVIFALLMAGLPSILARKRLPWRGGRVAESLLTLAFVVMVGVLAASLARPIVAEPPISNDRLRIATLNLHGGYSLYFSMDLPEIRRQLQQYGADIVLLQEVETGRLISYGVDQPAWLARQLNMQVEYYPTNEGIQGLAILTRLPVEESRGWLLHSQGKQTGVQFTRLRAPDRAELQVYNTELGFLFRDNEQSIEAQQQDQARQIQQIFELISQNDPPVSKRLIVGGTFNTVPDTDVYQYMIQNGFIDPAAGLPFEKKQTLKLVNGATAQVDYLFLRHITSHGVSVGQIQQSTHNIVVVEIGLQPATGQ
jgi:endonuclease/exonuclease/phosphatase family metal-dependent hydrolase